MTLLTLFSETDPDWKRDVENDVRDECNKKYGTVNHISLATDTDDGEIYIKFDRVQGGQNAYQGLNGRFYGHNTITASYIAEHVYNVLFPKARNV
jgi:RNA-binding protein 23/39